MKRILFALVALVPLLVLAQDIVVTKAGTNIEDVKVKAITDTEIIYVLNGTETALPRNEVTAILYEDGRYEEIRPLTTVYTNNSTTTEDNDLKVKTFTKEQTTREDIEDKLAQQQKKREAKERNHIQDSIKAANKAAAIERARIEQEQTCLAKERELQDGQIHRLACNKYYFVDRTYTKKDIKSIVLSCPNAKAKYDSGNTLMVAGWSTFGASAGVLLAGSIMSPLGSNDLNYGSGSDGLIVAGLVCLIVGPIAMAGGLTVASIGHYRMYNAYKVYNESCATKKDTPLSLNFGVTQNGIGLTLYF